MTTLGEECSCGSRESKDDRNQDTLIEHGVPVNRPIGPALISLLQRPVHLALILPCLEG